MCNWLLRAQEPDGSWFGRWGANHVYGTGAAVPALIAAGLPPDDPVIVRAVCWLHRKQNVDGGWGEDLRSYRDRGWRGRGVSTASQTAWALLALHAAGAGDSAAGWRGVDWLVRTPAPRRWLGRGALHRHRVPRRLLHQLPPVPAGLPDQRPRAAARRRRGVPVTAPDWILYAPMRLEARALRRGLPADAPVRRTGWGVARAGRAAAARTVVGQHDAERSRWPVSPVDFRRCCAPATWWWPPRYVGPGGTAICCPTAPMIAAALRRRGLTAHLGPVVTSERLVDGAARDRLARSGALAVDTETAVLLAGAAHRPVACVRAIADVPPDRLFRPATLARVRTALRALPPVGQVLAEWAAVVTAMAGAGGDEPGTEDEYRTFPKETRTR